MCGFNAELLAEMYFSQIKGHIKQLRAILGHIQQVLNVEAFMPSRGHRNSKVWLTVLIWKLERGKEGGHKIGNAPSVFGK